MYPVTTIPLRIVELDLARRRSGCVWTTKGPCWALVESALILSSATNQKRYSDGLRHVEECGGELGSPLLVESLCGEWMARSAFVRLNASACCPTKLGL
jgi:hypothetical protein